MELHTQLLGPTTSVGGEGRTTAACIMTTKGTWKSISDPVQSKHVIMLGYFLSRHQILVLIHVDNRIDDVVQLVKDAIFLLHVF